MPTADPGRTWGIIMKTLLVTLCLVLLSAAPGIAAADEVTLSDNPPQVYVVKEGDTLWQIATIFLQDPWEWQEIWEINLQLDNPHLIFPGDQIYLVYVEGQPRLRVRRGAEARTVKLTPNMRIEPLDKAIPIISLEQIGAWLSGHRVVSPEQLSASPYVVAGAQRHLLSAAGDLFYARGFLPADELGYGIYREGEIYVDPVTEEILGLQAQDIGSATLLEQHGDGIGHLEVTRITEEVRNGDRLISNEARKISASFIPRSPDWEVNAEMIAVDGGVSQIGVLDIVVINRGERENMEAGHILAIYQTGEKIRDDIAGERLTLPDVRAGLLMVFRTFEKMSYGIVLKTNRPLVVGDRVSNP